MKNKGKKNKSSKIFKKGFSLIEALISVLIFSLAVVMMIGSFANLLREYNDAKRAQRNVENAQYVMNLMAKSIRTSVISDPAISPNMITFDTLDYTQNQCIRYIYDGVNDRLRIGRTADTGPSLNEITDCNWGSLAIEDLTDSVIRNAYIDAETSNPSAPGRVTISLEVEKRSDSGDVFPIQMSVSLRQ